MSVETETKKKIVIQPSPKYCNIFYNNDLTPFNYVIHVLVEIFGYDPVSAEKKTQEIHKEDKAVVFISTKESCDTKKEMTSALLNAIGETNLEHDVKLYDDEQ